jgi:hypothetical protein
MVYDCGMTTTANNPQSLSVPTRKVVVSQDFVLQSDIEIEIPDVDAILGALEDQVAALQTAAAIDLVETASLGHYVRCQGQVEALDGVLRLIENLRG